MRTLSREEEEERSKLEKEWGEHNGEFFFDPLTIDAGLDLRANPLEEEENDAKMGGLSTWKETYLDSVRKSIVLVPRASLKYFCGPHIAKLFDGLEVGSHNEEVEAEIEEARLVFDPGDRVWMHSCKKNCPKSKFLFDEYYDDLRTNLFEERENDVIMGSLSMWKEAYKDTTLIS